MALRSRHIVFVHGLLGWGPRDLGGLAPYWGEALARFDGALTPHEAKCGPISSLHDRACEVFAQIAGTRVDYGAAHSRDAGHSRYSRDYSNAGFVPNWSAENPIVAIGHSAGAATCLVLQKLLAEDFWGLGTSADWIEVVVGVAGALNGSTLAYRFCDARTGRLTGLPSVLVTRGLGLVRRFLDLGTTPLFDLYLDQWVGQPDPNFDSTMRALDASGFVAGEDNLAYDMTLQGSFKANAGFAPSSSSYYFSFVTGATRESGWFGLPFGARTQRPVPTMHLILRDGARHIATRPEFSISPVADWGDGELTLAHWRENDGVVNSISQRYPFLAGARDVGGEGVFSREGGFERGKWYFERLDAALGQKFDHLDVVHGFRSQPFPALRDAHRRFYAKLNKLLLGL
jgi:hypothetical protein